MQFLVEFSLAKPFAIYWKIHRSLQSHYSHIWYISSEKYKPPEILYSFFSAQQSKCSDEVADAI